MRAEKALENRSDPAQTRVTLKVHPRNLSRLRGQRNENIRLLEKRFGLTRLKVSTDAQLPDGCVRVQKPPSRPGGRANRQALVGARDLYPQGDQ